MTPNRSADRQKTQAIRASCPIAALTMALLAQTLVLGAPAERDGDLLTNASVSVSRQSFDPTDGQTTEVTVDLKAPGRLDLFVLDRDGYRVRRLADSEPVGAGRHVIAWDGKADDGQVVADEAYSLLIRLKTPAGTYSYAPLSTPPERVDAKVGYYDRQTGIFRYELSRPARVHIQAGTAKLDASTGKRTGPVLKTLANREPRPSGYLVETWNGLDESGGIFVPDLPDFVMALAATSLPENAIIAYGNRVQPFLAVAAARQGAPMVTAAPSDHHHHAGLKTLEDVSPSLHFQLDKATYLASSHAWKLRGSSLTGSLSLDGVSSSAFAAEPGTIYVFVDGERHLSMPVSSASPRFEVPMTRLPAGRHIVAFNWVSDYGPAAVAAVQIDTSAKAVPSQVGK